MVAASTTAPPQKHHCPLRKCMRTTERISNKNVCRRPQSRWMQWHLQRKLCSKLVESRWMHTCGQPLGHVNHRTYLWDHWGCVGGMVPRAQREQRNLAQCWSYSLSWRGRALSDCGFTTRKGLSHCWLRYKLCLQRAPYSLMNTPKVCEFPSNNDLHANVLNHEWGSVLRTWSTQRCWMKSSPKPCKNAVVKTSKLGTA